jgi:uncharacterized protein (UPF0276 family)
VRKLNKIIFRLVSQMMMVVSRIFSLHGKGLKLDTRTDIERYLKDVDPTKIEEIHFGGNTLGVEASKALAEFLANTEILKVCLCVHCILIMPNALLRLQISPISLQVA